MANSEKKAAKKAAKAEKKANRTSNPEMTKAIISAVTAIVCVVAVVVTSSSIVGKICDTNIKIAEDYAANASSGAVSSDSSYVDDSSAVAGDSTVAADDTVAADPSADAAADANAPAADANAPAADANAATGAPVGNDIAKIVAYYNSAANNTKAYKGTMKLNILQGTSSAVTETSLPSAAISIVNGLLPNDYPTKKTFTVKNGQGEGYNERKQENESKPLADILPIDGTPKMSTLTADGVKSAKCEKVAGGYKVTLVLKSETIHSLDDKPKHHSSCMDVLDITADDIKPFTANKMDIIYPGATLTATINDQNLLTEFDVNEPVDVVGDVEWTVVKASIVIDASWKQNVKFTY